jgi:hypothetical protein
MLLFLAGVLEQMDLALEHIAKRDVHNARFGLMLTDNALELVLHQIAKDKSGDLKAFLHLKQEYRHTKALDDALGRSFDAKVKFAKLEGKLSEEVARTFGLLHALRNEVYHIGLQHEHILPELAEFYFVTACEFLAGYRPRGLGWSSSQVLPERARKYFTGPASFPGEFEDFGNACRSLSAACSHDAGATIETLADHMERVVNDMDTCIGIIADGVYDGQKTTRDAAIVDCQAWRLAFTDEGREFASNNGWPGGNVLALVEWLAKTYKFKTSRDPIASWTTQVARLRANKSPHTALANYQSFMDVTATIREVIVDAAMQVEAEIDRLIDERRGK